MNAGIPVGAVITLVLGVWLCCIAAAQGTTIDEVGSVVAGEMVTISGTTNLAPGNRLIITVTPVGFEPTNKSASGRTSGTSGTAVVEEGSTTTNTWSFEADTTGFEPGEYVATVEWVEGDATASTTFAVTGAAPTTPAVTAVTPSTTAPTQSPTPTAAGPTVPLAAALAIGLTGHVLKRR
ncbi:MULTISPECIES: hypothetical protein [unclassified Methanoculleus]|jgi:hypothetical protein|uniref:PGF-CTERM sorting domain-containing protein n=1 Tax=Methanoculleus palmolei TaxID=72612 RepID=A0ABD8AA73_9EURY|nr:hypothetical protein [Methanoculleus sp. UBA377]MDD2473917.1 hypothetical protein [Methanoculleus sp.]WOX56392.1 hypothetical protein R6Y95_03420 [Methanoculleus palmolei]